ncbi:hypothetical protein RKE29_21310 [Streptomyces sp. B1866]|uniref:hypothetical protein n=1 Tax=Streptomyces sp. B1866 TaxID=3075431 RepID=UPI00289048DC|nr:hypothetical protein [Streptomyces sp. B1866]MDT3399153.1 hypothetical protein [Streptomyces sp. B1866]
MARPVPPADILLKLLGAPYQTELITSALRLTQALLDRGARVQVWACGEATRLTWAGLGEAKPRHFGDWEREYPSPPAVVRGLLEGYPDRLHWYVCGFCCDERGTGDQIARVRRRPLTRFADHVRAAGKSLSLGVA